MRSGAVAALASAALGLAAGCAPVASFRPPVAVASERTLEVGGGGVALAPRPYADEPWRLAGQTWAAGPVGGRTDLGAVVAFDLAGLAAGVTLRLRLVAADRFALALDAEVGWAFVALSAPLGVRVAGDTWVYAAPRALTWGPRPAVGLVLGASTGDEDTSVRVEGQATWPDVSPYQRRLAFGVAAAQQI